VHELRRGHSPAPEGLVIPTIIGVDPGLTTGIAVYSPAPVLRSAGAWDLLQVTRGAVLPVVRALSVNWPVMIAVEGFVVGPRAARSSTPEGGRTARELISVLSQLAGPDVQVVVRNASQVKPWATDKRLDAAGVPTTPGMRHARDGARQALYSAVRDCGLPDPLSTRHRSPEVSS
jgi:hypothetical protein